MDSFSVRCLFRWTPIPSEKVKYAYEERITLWQADSFDTAIGLAEQEARQYAAKSGFEFLNFCQTYELAERIEVHGAEVFSLIRESDLEPSDYIDAFFDTGLERQERP